MWPKIETQFKDEWVKALRSGEYKQVKNTLYDAKLDSYCCLGVACKIAIGKLRELANGDQFINPSIEELPSEITGVTRLAEHLATLNDSGKSFNEIADWIDANL